MFKLVLFLYCYDSSPKYVICRCSRKGCIQKFSKETFRISHEQCHVAEPGKGFVCHECGKKFSVWRACLCHYWNVHKIDMGLLSCPMCDEYKARVPGKKLKVHKDIFRQNSFQ